MNRGLPNLTDRDHRAYLLDLQKGLNDQAAMIAKLVTQVASLKAQLSGTGATATTTAPTRASESSMKQQQGTITTRNLAPTVEPTPGSTVTLAGLDDHGIATVQVTGSYTGALQAQRRVNGADWDDAPLKRMATGEIAMTISSGETGIWTFPAGGCDAVRVSAIAGAVTGAAAVTLRAALPPAPEQLADDAAADVLQGWDEGDRAKVNLIAAQAGVDGNAGAAGAKTLRVVQASDSPEQARLGAINEAAPASDTADAGLNGRLKRIAQRLSSLLAALTDGSARVVAGLLGTKTLSSAVVSFSASGDNVIVAAVSGQSTRVHRLYFVADGATAVTMKRGSTALTGAMPLAAGVGIFLEFSSEPWYQTGVNEDFVIASSMPVQVSGAIEYVTGP